MTDIGDGQIQPFGSGRRHDMGGITREKQSTILHRLDDKATHRQDAFLRDGPYAHLPVVFGR